jgi:predicted SAM-dependent methyltransferase
MSLETPVVLLVFNRPHEAKRVLAAIAQARPRLLFVVADGPRPERPEDPQAVAQTRSLIEGIDWPCEVRKNYAPTNLGLRSRVLTGLDWVFDQVEEAIILEDDCLPDPSFFPYCQELLARYRTDERIVSVRGTNLQIDCSKYRGSYSFLRQFVPWGWATWRRVWQGFDPLMTSWPEFLADGGLWSVTDSPEEEAYYGVVFDNTYRRLANSWHYSFAFYCWTRNGLSITPHTNLISNIGFGNAAVHTTNPADALANLPTQPIGVLQHPVHVVRNKAVDESLFRVARGLAPHASATEDTIAAASPAQPNAGGNLQQRLHDLEMRVLAQMTELHEKEGVIQQQHQALVRLQKGRGRWVHALARRASRLWQRLNPRRTRTGQPAEALPIGLRHRPLQHASRIVLGAGHTYYLGWQSTDQAALDITRREDYLRYWNPGTREAFLAEHIWEHLTEDQARRALAHCFEFLRPGGRLRLAVPDGLHPDPAYREHVRPGGSGPGADDHQVLYDYRHLGTLLSAAGFKVQFLEYWDEDGKLHCQNWSLLDGPIRRSASVSRPGSAHPFQVTSLIVDAVKPCPAKPGA